MGAITKRISGDVMKIFGLYIYTRKGLDRKFNEYFEVGVNRGMGTQDKLNRASLQPVVYSLKELRQNTWDVERVDQAIRWLESCYE